MTFESPGMLLGLFFLGVILWIHFRRRRQNKISFPAVRLLMTVVKKKTSQIKLRRVFLLIARLAAVASFVLAMSSPGLSVKRPGGIRAGKAIAQVIVLDDSLSMRRILGDGESAFSRAKSIAVRELGRLRPGDGAALILSGRPARKVVREVIFDLELVSRGVKLAQPSYRGGDISGAVTLAANMLEDNSLPQREVILVTDLSEKDWAERGVPWTKEAGISFRVLSAVEGEESSNVAVEAISVEPFWGGNAKEVLVEARVANYGDKSIENLEVVLELDGRVAASGRVNLPANGYATKKFHHRFDTIGAHRGAVKISTDKLLEDNLRHFTVNVRKTLKALIINGDHRPGSYKDEAFYLNKALSTPTPGDVAIKTIVWDVETAAASPLTGNDVIFLAGVEALPISLAGRLIQFVKGGGGLFISPGNRGANLELLEPIMPGVIRSMRHSVRPGKSFRVGAVNRSHPIFQPFGEAATGLEDVRVNKHLLVEPDGSMERTVVAQLKDGVPFLLERHVDQGISMLLCTTIDRDWTDLPIRPGYLPMVQRAARYLAGRLEEVGASRVIVGQAKSLEVSAGMKRLVVLDPKGGEKIFSANDLAGRTKINYLDTLIPGSYRTWAEVPEFGGMRELTTAEFVVEIDPVESNLSQSEPGELGFTENESTGIATVEGRFPLWPYLLLAGLIFLLIETWIASFGFRRSHVRN